MGRVLAYDGPAVLGPQALEAVATYPEVDSGPTLRKVSMSIAAAFFLGLLPFGKARAMVADAGKAKPAMIVRPMLVGRVPLFPLE